MPNLDTSPLKTAVQEGATLCSVFDRVTDTGRPPKDSRNSLVPCVLTNENIVSNTGIEPKDALPGDLARFELLSPESQAHTYPYLLQKYGWRIGSPDGPEVQEVAYCDAVRLEEALRDKGPDGYLLVKGDLSGIQGYIYGNIQQKTAGGLSQVAKRLRGRSILVTLLTDFLANVVLRELNLPSSHPSSHLLFAGGGHFNLLLPNSEEMRKKLRDVEKDLDAQMRHRFNNRLQLILADVPCSEEEITKEAGQCFKRLAIEHGKKKYRQHHEYLHHHFYPPPEEKPESKEDREKRDQWEIQIGERFPKKDILIEAVTDSPLSHTEEFPTIVTFKMPQNCYSLLVAEDFLEAKAMLKDISDLRSAQVFSINNTDIFPKSGNWANNISFGFRFLGKTVPLAQKTGKQETRPQTFEEIARGLPDGGEADKAEKIPLEMLGAMRLDVDDLGYIFSRGLCADASLGQIVTLSREMYYFFSAHFDQLAKQHHLYLIYSGGDDAFVVGKWDKLIPFSTQLHIDFRDFTKNDKMHFSAGIYLGDPHYPVGRFYRDAGSLQDAAKDSNRDKNRIHIFNHPLCWPAYHKKIDFGKGLVGMLTKGDGKNTRKLTMAFAYRLLQLVKTSFHERTGIDERTGEKYWRGSLNMRRFARNVANMRYLFARHGYDKAETEKVLEEVEKELINDFLRNFDFGDKGNMNAVRDNLVALNYALYTIRSQKNAPQQNG